MKHCHECKFMLSGTVCILHDKVIDPNEIASPEGYLEEAESLEEASLLFPKLLKEACDACPDYMVEKWPPTWKKDDELYIDLMFYDINGMKTQRIFDWLNEDNNFHIRKEV